MKRVLIRIAKVLAVVALVLILTQSVLSIVGGRRYEAELRKLKASGEPYTLVALAGPPIPADKNGSVFYEKIFERLLGRSVWVIAERTGGSTNAAREKKLKDENQERDRVYQKLKSDNPMTPDDWTQVAEVAAKYDWVLPLVEQAVAKPQCKFPVNWKAGAATLFPHLAQMRELERILVVKAAVYAHEGDADSAARCIRLAVGSANAIKDDPSLISVLVRIAQINTATEGLQWVLQETHLSPSQAKSIYDAFGTVDFREHAVLSAKGERGLGLMLFQQIRHEGYMSELDSSSDGALHKALFSSSAWRAVSYFDGATYLRYMQKQIDLAQKPYRYLSIDQKNDNDLKGVPSYCVFTRLLAPIYTRAYASVDKGTAECAMGQAAMALAAYRDKFGTYPSTLEEASAKVGWRIPEDPFADSGLIYRRQVRGFKLYSIGPNLRDDNGTPPSKDKSVTDKGDIVFSVDH